jgi:hypothetical protein
VLVLFYRAKEWFGGLGPADSTLGTLRTERASTLWGVVRDAVRDRLACVALVLLYLFAVLMPPIQCSSASGRWRAPQGLRRNLALPASDFSYLSVTAWNRLKAIIVTARSEDGEDDDEPCGATRQAYDTYDLSLSLPRGAPDRDLAVPGRPSALRPLRC